MSMFSVHPYGGVGQIGANSTLFTLGDKKVLVDAGALFPLEEGLGVNILVPKYEDLEELDAIIITHGHEDHIGGIEVVQRKFPDATIYTSNFTAKMLRKKNIGKLAISIVNEKSLIHFGKWKFSPFYVDHSIPETFAATFWNEHEDQFIFFAPDFKINTGAGISSQFSFDRLKKMAGPFKHRMLFVDSTNILSEQLKTPAEQEVVEPLRKLFKESEGRIFATFFPSNVERLKTFLDLALEQGLMVSMIGRSMRFFLDLALETGYLKTMPRVSDVILPHKRSLILISGCQGDFNGSLRGAILDGQSKCKLKEKDIFIYSAKVIPGNEKKVALIFNKIVASNVALYNSDNYFTHVSGHAGRDDLKLLIQNLCPQVIVPIHTESHFLPAFRKWHESEFPEIEHVQFANGETLVVGSDGLEIERGEGVWEFNIVHDNGQIMDKDNLRDRRKLAESGIVSLAIQEKKNHPNYKFNFFGLPFHVEDQADFDAYIFSVVSSFKMPRDAKLIEKKVKEYFVSKYSFKPNVSVVLL